MYIWREENKERQHERDRERDEREKENDAYVYRERQRERKRHRVRDRERERVRRYKVSEEKWMGTAKIGPARDSIIRISATVKIILTISLSCMNYGK